MYGENELVISRIKESNQPSPNNHKKGKVCPYCGQSSQTVFVHGHEQCVVCKTNVEPCCQGEVPKSSWVEVGKLIKGVKWVSNKS